MTARSLGTETERGAEQCEENWWRPAAWAAAIMVLALGTSSHCSVLCHSYRHQAEKLFSLISTSENFKPLYYLTPEHCCHPPLKGANETSRTFSQYLERVPTRTLFNEISRVFTPTAKFRCQLDWRHCSTAAPGIITAAPLQTAVMPPHCLARPVSCLPPKIALKQFRQFRTTTTYGVDTRNGQCKDLKYNLRRN